MKSCWTKSKKTCFLLVAVLALGSTTVASTYYVGTCHSPSYSTISAAVTAATPNATVDVCPGTYPEQVFISKPLTLQGIKSANAGRARIVVPTTVGGGVNWQFVPYPGGSGPVAPQIYVTAPAGTVNITDLTIDASGETSAPACGASGGWLTVAIMYQDSSGTISKVNTLGQGKNSGCGTGILAYAVTAANSVTIRDSSIQDTNDGGIFLVSGAAAAPLTVNVSDNSIVVGTVGYVDDGIDAFGVAGTISSNTIESSNNGIYLEPGAAPDPGPLTITNNSIHGINTLAPGPVSGIYSANTTSYQLTISGNKVVDFHFGLEINARTPANPLPDVVKNNLVMNRVSPGASAGILLNCEQTTLSGNIVNNTGVGVIDAPGNVLPAGIVVENVDQVQSNSCP
jgi:hypothetical protein